MDAMLLLSKTFRASWSIGLAAALLAAVPQDISIGCANNERALADRKGRLRPNADHSRLVLAV